MTPAALLARAQRDGRLPSVVGGLVADGRLVWVGGAGEVSDLWSDTQYRIGSITKTFTAVLLLAARDAGLLRLDDPLSAYVPEAPWGERTLACLLSHRAGLPGEPAGPWWERSPGGSFADLVAANADVAAMAAEGVEHRYSNLGYALLGEVAARVYGEDWWSLVQRRILEPLGLTRTTYHPVAPHADGWSVSHLLATLTPEPATDTGAMAPAGQLWSTVTDLAAYAGFVLRGHPDVLSLATLEEAAVPLNPRGERYGLGFRSAADGRLVGHTGTMPGFMASFLVDRAAGTAYVGFANGTVGQQSVPLATAMLDALAAGEALDDDPTGEPWRPATDVPDEVAELVGPWHWGETAFELRWNGDELELVETRDQSAYEEYTRSADGRWIGTDRTELEVVRHPDGSLAWLLSETYLFTRTPYEPGSPVPGR